MDFFNTNFKINQTIAMQVTISVTALLTILTNSFQTFLVNLRRDETSDIN